MLAEPRTPGGRDSATHHRAGYRSARLFADVEQLAALVVIVPAAPGRTTFGAPLLKALITSRELAIGTVLVMPPVVRAHDPAAGLGADLNRPVRIWDFEDRLEIAVIGLERIAVDRIGMASVGDARKLQPWPVYAAAQQKSISSYRYGRIPERCGVKLTNWTRIDKVRWRAMRIMRLTFMVQCSIKGYRDRRSGDRARRLQRKRRGEKP